MKYNIGDVLIEHFLHPDIKFVIKITEIKENKYYFLCYGLNKTYWGFVDKIDYNQYNGIEYRNLTNEEKLELL